MKRAVAILLTYAMLLSGITPGAFAAAPMSRADILKNFAAVEQDVFTAAKSPYGHAANPNSSTLSWAASYMLEAYYRMYCNTGDIAYLKRLGEQFQVATGNLRDDLGNGSLGWDCTNYSVKRMADPGFDKALVTASSASQMSTAAWMVSFGSDPTRVLVDNTGVSGNGLHIKAGGGAYQGAQIHVADYAPGVVYELQVSVKTSGASGRIYLQEHTTGKPIPDLHGNEYTAVSSSGKWTTYALRFIVPDSGLPFSIHLEAGDPDAAGDMYFDNVAFSQAAQFQVHETMMLAPAAKFVKAVKADASLAAAAFDADTTYGQLADSFIPVIEALIRKWDAYWRPVGDDMGVYVWPNDDSSAYRGNTLPHNQYVKMASVMLPMYEVTKNPDYLDKATRMLTFLKSKMTPVTQNGRTLYYWHYYDHAFSGEKPQGEGTEDISHGALEVEAAITGYEYGIVFNEEDMKRITNTFLEALWNGDAENPEFYASLEYRPSSSAYHKPMTSELNIRDWTRMAQWEPKIAQAVTAFFNSGSPERGHPAKMLTYAYAYPYLQSEVTSIKITKVSGLQTQTAGSETPVVLSCTLNADADASYYDDVAWSVRKDGTLTSDTGSGRTFTYTPSGAGTYSVTAQLSGKKASFVITVSNSTGSGETGGGSGSGGGGSGGGSSGGGGSSSGGTAPSTTTKPEAEALTVTVSWDASTGVLSASVSSEALAAYLKTHDRATLTVPAQTSVKKYAISLPTASLCIPASTKTIAVETELGTIVLPCHSLTPDGSLPETALLSIQPLAEKERIENGLDAGVTISLEAAGKPLVLAAAISLSVPFDMPVDNPDSVVVLRADASGAFQPLPNGRYSSQTKTANWQTSSLSAFGIAIRQRSFTDLAAYSWARQQIEALACKGVINGTGEDTFSPGRPITRGDFVALLIRALELKEETNETFSDVSISDYYYPEIQTAKALGIATGSGGNAFHPQAPISRQDMMALIFRALEAIGYSLQDGELEEFTDASEVSEYALPAVRALTASGLVGGTNGKLDPHGNATRAEVAVILYRVLYA